MADLIENCRRHREMIGLLSVLGALLLGARAQEQEFRLVGSDVTLVPKYTRDLKEITWTLNDRIFVEVILKPQEEFIYPLPNDRTTINKTNGALTIRYLTRGDSGVYKVKVILIDDSIQETEIRLTVHDCPDQPIISVQSTEDQFVVSCKSFSPDVTYEWFNPTTSVSKSQLYTEPKKNGTLTCVVDNKVCNKSSSINLYTPEEKSVEYDVILVPQYTGDPSEIIWKVNGYKLVKMMLKPQMDRKFYRLQDRANISDTDGSLTIRDLTMEDSGVYTAVVLVNNDYYYTEIRLKYSRHSVWSIIGIVIVAVCLSTIIITILIILIFLWYYYYKKYRRLSCGSIAGRVIVVLCLITIINFIFLLSYFYYKKYSRLSGWSIALIIVVGFLLPITILLLWYYYYKKKKTCRKEHSKPFKVEFQAVKDSNNERAEEKKNCREEDSTPHKDSNNEREEESKKCITVKFWKDDISTSNESRGCLENHSKSLCLTIHEVHAADHGIFTAEAVMSDKKTDSFTDETKIDLWVGRKTNYVPKTEHLIALVWKKYGVTQFKWAVSSLKFHASNIKLEPGSVTVYNAKGKESYKVFFRLEEYQVCKSIRCITFHPSNMTDIDQITWKKDSQLLNTEGDRFKCEPNGDLTIYNATSEDKGKYTLQCKDKKLDQEFILHL